jgi:hypothetical protein
MAEINNILKRIMNDITIKTLEEMAKMHISGRLATELFEIIEAFFRFPGTYLDDIISIEGF